MIWERLVIEGNAVYEIDEECAKRRKEQEAKSLERRPRGRGRGLCGQERERG